MNTPLVSIIVPVYNTEKYLARCIESILKQSYTNLEIILVDDGSTDGCGQIIDEYAKKDKRIVVIHQKNGGQSRARNVGIDRVRGEFIGFVDSDDEIREDFVEKLMSKLNEGHDLAVTGVHYRWLKSNTQSNVYINKLRKQRKKESIEEYMIFLLVIDGRMYSSVNKLYRAKIIQGNKLYFTENMKFAEDTRFVMQYLKYATSGVGFVLEPLYIYNYGTETSTIKKSGTEWKNWLRSYADVEKFVGKNPNLSTRFWMKLLLLRWRISYWRSIGRARG